MIKLNAYAKVNLFLEIIGREPSGYHLVDTVMQSVSISDTLTMNLLSNDEGIVISSSNPSLPTDSTNICYKAAKSFFESTGVHSGVSIDIVKNIPSCAGMGGGSADGAAVIVGLNRLCGTNLSVEKLALIGAAVGADVPFCIYGGTAQMKKYGDVLEKKLPTRDMSFLVLKPQSGVSTPMAYKTLDMMFNFFDGYTKKDSEAVVSAIENNDINLIAYNLYNIFEQAMPICNTEVLEILKYFRNKNIRSLLSGSGSAVFAVFDNDADLMREFEKAKKKFPDCFASTARTTNAGVTIIN